MAASAGAAAGAGAGTAAGVGAAAIAAVQPPKPGIPTVESLAD
jgi:hypothetical protein